MIKSIVVFEHEIAIKWKNDEEQFLPLKNLRLACPCAGCSGETDVFGTTYANKPSSLILDAYKIKTYEHVGLYGVRFFWADGHKDGIYTFEFLKNIKI